MKISIGDKVGEGCYPIFGGHKSTTYPIGYAVKQKKGWLGIRNTHAFTRGTRAAVIESLEQAALAELRK